MNQRMKYIVTLSLSLLTIFLSLGISAAQPSSKKEEKGKTEIAPPNESGYVRNEIAIANLWALVSTTEEKAFIVARLGDGETSHALSRRRLECVKDQESFPDMQKVLFVEGERVKGLGRVEFYLGSQLMHVALAARNGNIISRCNARTGRIRSVCEEFHKGLR